MTGAPPIPSHAPSHHLAPPRAGLFTAKQFLRLRLAQAIQRGDDAVAVRRLTAWLNTTMNGERSRRRP